MGMTSYLKAKPTNPVEIAQVLLLKRITYLNANPNRGAGTAVKDRDECER